MTAKSHETEINHVDAFTAEPFRGNPACVCLLDQPRDAEWMQSVATEMNLSETAFLVPEGDAFGLRWFTPTVEVKLCGHATLASAHTLWSTGRLDRSARAVFHTASGDLFADRRDDWIELDFPGFHDEESEMTEEVYRALKVDPDYVGFLGHKKVGEATYLILLRSEKELRGLVPELGHLRNPDSPCLLVTAPSSSPEFDFVSRFFAPAAGIDEDPVTGSAHCCLAPFWSRRLKKNELMGFQASRRGGVVGMRIEGDRVILRGQAVTTMRGALLV